MVLLGFFAARKRRPYSEARALARGPLAVGQPLELFLPAGPAVLLMMSFDVVGHGTVDHPRYGIAVRVRSTRSLPTDGDGIGADQCIVVGTDDVVEGGAASVRARWVEEDSAFQQGKGPTETGGKALLGKMPAGDACTVRFELALAGGTEGGRFTIYVNPAP